MDDGSVTSDRGAAQDVFMKIELTAKGYEALGLARPAGVLARLSHALARLLGLEGSTGVKPQRIEESGGARPKGDGI